MRTFCGLVISVSAVFMLYAFLDKKSPKTQYYKIKKNFYKKWLIHDN